jgi:hypothetical protein
MDGLANGAADGAQAEYFDDAVAEEPVTPHHPVVDEYAPFTEAELDAMRKSLRENGLIVPIVTWHGKVVDGRHREMLCRRLRINPRFNDITKRCPTEDDMRKYVAALNQHRRSRTSPLTAEEKAAATARADAEVMRDPDRSDRAIGAVAKVSHKTVAKARKRRASAGVGTPTPPSERKSTTGKVGEGQRKTPPAKSTEKAELSDAVEKTADQPTADLPTKAESPPITIQATDNVLLANSFIEPHETYLMRLRALILDEWLPHIPPAKLTQFVEDLRDEIDDVVRVIEKRKAAEPIAASDPPAEAPATTAEKITAEKAKAEAAQMQEISVSLSSGISAAAIAARAKTSYEKLEGQVEMPLDRMKAEAKTPSKAADDYPELPVFLDRSLTEL